MSGKHMCPVCGKFEFEEQGSFDICEVCGWEDDIIQERNPDEDCCANQMSLNEAREAYKMGISEDDAVDIKYAVEKMTFSEGLKAFKEGKPLE